MKLIDKSTKKIKYLAYFRGMQALIQGAKEGNEPWNVYHWSAILITRRYVKRFQVYD